MDNSGAQGLSTICLTLWGEKAESFDSTNHHKVILSRGSNVGEWQSKINISLGFSGTVVVDPPGCEEADQLRAWFLRENSATEGGIAGKLGDSRFTHKQVQFYQRLKYKTGFLHNFFAILKQMK